MPTTFPNELIHVIFCDILATYVHSFVLLPPTYDRWHAHFTLRRVSRHFKALADDIWNSAVGPAENWHELGELHAALCAGNYNPSQLSSSPLICAYGAYVIGVSLRQNPQAKTNLAKKAYQLPDSDGSPRGDGWFSAGIRLSRRARPRGFGSVLETWVCDTMEREHQDDLIYCLEDMTDPILYEVVDTHRAAILHQSLAILLEALNDRRIAPVLLHRMGYKLIANLEEINRRYPPLAQTIDNEDKAQNAIARSHKMLLNSINTLNQSWFTRYETRHYRKTVLDRAAKYGA